MSALAAWLTPRLPTLKAILWGSTTWPVAVVVLWFAWPEPAAMHDVGARLSYALQLAVAPAAVLFLMVMTCMRLLDTEGAEDPFAGKESRRWRINARVFQNTLEQAAIFVPALVGLALRVDPSHARILPILTLVWCLGRAMFWVGYHVHIAWRAPGFDWTFLTTTLALGWFAATWL